MATVVVTDGGSSGSSSQGSGNWSQVLKDLLPIVAVIGAAWLLWPYITQLLSSLTSGTGGASTGTSYGTSSGSGATSPYTTAIQSAISTPGTYINPPVSTTPVQGTGIGNLFVNTGPGAPANLFPLGDVISTSRPLTTAEQQQTLTNLANQPFLGWWSTPQQQLTVLSATAPANTTFSINSAGNLAESNPVGGQKTCPCTAELKASGVCGQNDDWYYC